MSDTVEPEEVQRFLAGAIYPANRAALLELARQQGADESALQALGEIPEQEYNGPTAVRRALIEREA